MARATRSPASIARGALASLLLGSLCCARACNVLRLTDEGFAQNVLTLLHALPVFHAPERGDFYLDNAAFPFKCNKTGGWHDFFLPVEGFKPWRKGAEDSQGECHELGRIDVDKELTKVQVTHQELENVSIQRVWRYQPWVAKEVAQILREVARHPRPTLALHARGGDITGALSSPQEGDAAAQEPGNTHERLVSTFQQFYPGEKVRTCLVVGDDAALVDRTADLAEKTLGCAALRRSAFHAPRGYFQAEFAREDLPVRCKATLELLKDLEVFTHADYFVGSYESAVTRLTESLRFCRGRKERRTFADASAQHADWYSAIRDYYREQRELAAEGGGPVEESAAR